MNMKQTVKQEIDSRAAFVQPVQTVCFFLFAKTDVMPWWATDDDSVVEEAGDDRYHLTQWDFLAPHSYNQHT